MFRAGLLLLIRMYDSVYTRIAVGIRNAFMSHPDPANASQHKGMIYTNCCIYRIIPTDDEQ
jgi:hypothetical protein